LNNDPELKQAYTQNANELMKQLIVIIDTWISLGIMKPISEIEKKYLYENCWTLAQTWITYSEIIHTNISLKDSALDKVLHVYYILKPNFTDNANERIQRLMKMIEYDF